MGLTKTGTIGLIYSNRQGGRIEQLIQEAGCELLYLPAYSRLPQQD
jgi:hypothetical protein